MQINGREDYEAANLTTLPHNFRVAVGKTAADSFLLNLATQQATSLAGFKDAFGGTAINWRAACVPELLARCLPAACPLLEISLRSAAPLPTRRCRPAPPPAAGHRSRREVSTVDREGNIYTVSFPGLPKIYQDSAAVAADASLGVVSRYELATGRATKISGGDLFVMAAYSVTTNSKVVRAQNHLNMCWMCTYIKNHYANFHCLQIAWTMKRSELSAMTATVTNSAFGYYLSRYMRWHYFDAAGGGALDLHAYLVGWTEAAVLAKYGVTGASLLTNGPGLFSYMTTAGNNSYVQFTTIAGSYAALCTPSSGVHQLRIRCTPGSCAAVPHPNLFPPSYRLWSSPPNRAHHRAHHSPLALLRCHHLRARMQDKHSNDAVAAMGSSRLGRYRQ